MRTSIRATVCEAPSMREQNELHRYRTWRRRSEQQRGDRCEPDRKSRPGSRSSRFSGNVGRELSDDALFQLFETLTCYRRDFYQIDSPLSTPLLKLSNLRRIGGIHLCCDGDSRLAREPGRLWGSRAKNEGETSMKTVANRYGEARLHADRRESRPTSLYSLPHPVASHLLTL